MGKSLINKFWLGVLVISAIIFLVTGAYLIGNDQSLFTKSFELRARFNNANGLQEGNNVRFSGINVGTVKALEMESDTTILVVMTIKEELQKHIKKNVIATIGSDGLVGNMIVNILPGKGEAAGIEPGDLIETYSRIGPDDLMNTLNVTNENAALLTANLLRVSQSLVRGKGTLGRLLNDTVMAYDLQKAITNLRGISDRIDGTVTKVNTMLAPANLDNSVAGILLRDTVAANQLRQVLLDLETSSGNLKGSLNDLSETMNQLKTGEGAIHYLATDTVLVNQIQQTLQNVEEGTSKFNQNMEALQHHFLFKGYFKKLEKESEN